MSSKSRQNSRNDDEPRIRKVQPKRRNVMRLSNPSQIMGLIEEDQSR